MHKSLRHLPDEGYRDFCAQTQILKSKSVNCVKGIKEMILCCWMDMGTTLLGASDLYETL